MKQNPETRPYDDEADARMLAGIANGDRRNFQQLHDRYDGLLFTTIEKVLNDREDSQEVLQEVMFSLWKKAHLYHPGRGRPVTWLASMARNRAIDRLRAKQRQAKLKNAYQSEIDISPRGSAGVSGPEAARRRDNCRKVRSAVLELTDVQREAIEKVYFQGLTQQEIANELGEPLGTVKARIRRGLAKLRKTVDAE
ncbi:MAG: RNA polymerase subunit sigma [Verrucomicrobiales bacterium]|nr:RNA polymerase subunit sigma [Verrucomicrobiales bacterium]